MIRRNLPVVEEKIKLCQIWLANFLGAELAKKPNTVSTTTEAQPWFSSLPALAVWLPTPSACLPRHRLPRQGRPSPSASGSSRFPRHPWDPSSPGDGDSAASSGRGPTTELPARLRARTCQSHFPSLAWDWWTRKNFRPSWTKRSAPNRK